MAYNTLIVDDSATIRAMITKILKIAGVPVGELWEASNGSEALEILNKNWVDLVFTDINMPVMNGVEMIEQMEADGMLSSVLVIVVSTEGSSARKAELFSKGVRAYIRKPFTAEELKRVIDEVLEENHDEDNKRDRSFHQSAEQRT